jgi:hypothetical protein
MVLRDEVIERILELGTLSHNEAGDVNEEKAAGLKGRRYETGG